MRKRRARSELKVSRTYAWSARTHKRVRERVRRLRSQDVRLSASGMTEAWVERELDRLDRADEREAGR